MKAGWIILIAGLLLLAGCAAPAAQDRSHRVPAHLEKRLWNPQEQRFADWPEVKHNLAEADYLLLGENHGHPDHHRLQAFVINQLAPQTPLIFGFEQINTDRKHALRTHLARSPHDHQGLRQAIDWDASGWPDWELYEPVFQATLQNNARPVPLNLPQASLAGLREQGLAAVESEAFIALLEETPWTPQQQDALEEELNQAHGFHAPEPMLEQMSQIQRARDAHMAWKMARVRNGKLAVMILGSGHARLDRGVPLYLRTRDTSATIVSLSFVETEETTTVNQQQILAPPADRELPYDWVWLTGAQNRPDPAEQLQDHFDDQ